VEANPHKACRKQYEAFLRAASELGGNITEEEFIALLKLLCRPAPPKG